MEDASANQWQFPLSLEDKPRLRKLTVSAREGDLGDKARRGGEVSKIAHSAVPDQAGQG